MSIYHCSIKVGSRGAGASACGAAAYRAGDKIRDNETGLLHDYERKSGVVKSEIMLCENAPQEYMNRETLWNAAQAAERQANGQYFREIEVALPREMSRDQQIEAVREYCRENFVEKGMCCDWSLHDKGDGNPHCHIMTTMRGIDVKGRWEPKRRDVYANDRDENGRPIYNPDKPGGKEHRIPRLDKNGNQKLDKKGGRVWERVKVDVNDWNNPKNAELWRAAWARTCNKYLSQDDKIDHRSFVRRGIEHITPTKHEGFAAREIERRGGIAQVCEVNREIRRINAARQALENERNGVIVNIEKARKNRILRQRREELEKIRSDRNGITRKQTAPNRAGDTGRTGKRRRAENHVRRTDQSDARSARRNPRHSFADIGRARDLSKMSFFDMDKEAPRVSVLLPDTERDRLEIERSTGMRDHGVLSAPAARRDGNRIKYIITRRKAAEKAAIADQKSRISENASKISEIKANRVSARALKTGLQALETGADLAVGAIQKCLPNDQAQLVGASVQMIKSAFDPSNLLPHKAIGNALKIVMQAAEAGNKAAQAFLSNPGALPDNIKGKWEWLSETEKADLLYKMSLHDDEMGDIGTSSFMKGYKPQAPAPSFEREPRARAIWDE